MTNSSPEVRLLNVVNVSVKYGAVQALHGINLSVSPGQVVAIVGPNGAGKSSLLRAISGVTAIRSGDVKFLDRSIRNQKPYRIAQAGLLHAPESRDIFGGMSTWENLKVAFDNLNAHDEKAEFERIYGLFPILHEKRDQLAGNLSGGQQQMLTIARALLGRPRLLMLDEPSLGLAQIIINDIYGALDVLKRDGLSLLLVEQNARKALGFADYSYVLVNGKIVLEGKREAIATDRRILDHYLGNR